MNIYEISDCQTNNPNQSQYAENYLINKLCLGVYIIYKKLNCFL